MTKDNYRVNNNIKEKQPKVKCLIPPLISLVCGRNGEIPGGGDSNSSMPGCVCPNVKDMGPFLASSE